VAENGLLTEVRAHWVGTETSAAAPSGASSVTALDASDISPGDTIWLDGAVPMGVNAVDYTTNVVTLAGTLAAAYDVATPLVPDAGGSPAQEWWAEVLLPNAEEPIEVPVTFHDRGFLEERAYEPPIPVDLYDDLSGIEDIPGAEMLIPQSSYVPPDLSTILTPTSVPAGSPAIISVTGTNASLVVQTAALPIDEAATREIHVWQDDTAVGGVHGPTYVPTPGDASTLFVDTSSQVTVVDHLPDGTSLVPNTTYFVATYAHNSLGYAPAPSPTVTGALNLENIDTVVAAQLVAGFALLGSIQVGDNITIDSNTGIQVLGGAALRIPADGSAISITADVVANTLEVDGNLTIKGGGTIYGAIQLSNGVQAPNSKPGISTTWLNYQTGLYTDGSDRSFYFAGMAPQIDDANWFVIAGTLWGLSGLSNGASGSVILNVHRDASSGTGFLIEARNGASKAWQQNFEAHGGIATDPVGNCYYLLGQDYDRGGDWYIYRIQNGAGGGSSFNKLSEWRIGGPTAFSGYEPRIAFDTVNNRLGMFWQVGTTDLLLRWFLPDLSAQTGTDRTLITNPGGRTGIGGAWIGADGTGTSRIYVALRNTQVSGNNNVLAWSLPAGSSTNPTRNATQDFPRAANNVMSGVAFDATNGRMAGLARNGRLYKHGLSTAQATLTAEHAWADENATGGKHETAAGPSNAVTWPARTYLVLTVPPPPDATDTNPGHTDKADSVRLYCSTTGGASWAGYRLFSPSTWSATLADLSGLTAGSPNAGTPFPSGVAPSSLQSTAMRSAEPTVPMTFFDGAGAARADSLVAPGTLAFYGGNVLPSGWLLCDGSAVSRTTYAQLFSAVGLGKLFGGGDGSTTFNLPDFRGRFPIGVVTGDPTAAGSIGAYETSNSGGHPSGAADTSRLQHTHTHTISPNTLSQTKATNTAATGSATRVTDISGDVLGSHAHGGDTASSGVGGANLNYHGFMAVNVIVKA
jgi:microcystin-dependent protein